MQNQTNPTYLKAITIRDPSDIHTIKEDIKKGMILILRVTPLAQRDVEKLRKRGGWCQERVGSYCLMVMKFQCEMMKML